MLYNFVNSQTLELSLKENQWDVVQTEQESQSWVLVDANTNQNIQLQKEETEVLKKEKKNKQADKQYDDLRKQQVYKEAIEAWNWFFEENKLIAALQSYTRAKKLNPDDETIQVRLGDVQYALHNYKLAYELYKWNDWVVGFSKKKEVHSLFQKNYELELSDIEEIQKNLTQTELTEQERAYYVNSLQCVVDFSKCKQYYKDYTFNPEVTIDNPELLVMKEGIEAYENSGLDDLNYKDVMIIAKFFENEHYSVVLKLWNDMLEWYPNYGPLIRLVGKSYYELWEYEKAADILKPYYEKHISDANLAYFLGLISVKQKLYLSSNIYLNKALKNGYTPKEDILRKLIYNYFVLNNKEKMYETFEVLLEEPWVNVSDYSLVIYQAIIEKDYDKAEGYIKKWNFRFPEESRFYGFLVDIYTKQGRYSKAREVAEEWKTRNPKDLAIIYYEWILYMEEKEYTDAFIAFRRVKRMGNVTDAYSDLADEQLEKLKKLRTKDEESN